MTHATPPKGRGALARREARLAWGLLFPTVAAVALVIVLPLLGHATWHLYSLMQHAAE